MSREDEDAFDRARIHLRQAALESLEAARALLEVAIKASGLGEIGNTSWVGDLRTMLEDLIAEMRRTGVLRLPSAIAEPLSAAVEAEITRWEMRSRNDPDARLVLRAFLGLRELLWELGMRPAPPTKEPEAKKGSTQAPRPAPAPRARVQRFKLED